MTRPYLTFTLLVGCVVAAALPANCQPTGDEISIAWNLLGNARPGPNRFSSELIVTNHGTVPLSGDGWQLYFNFGRQILGESLPDDVSITHVNGDLFRLQPSDSFKPLMPGDSFTIAFQAAGWAIKESDAPSGFYFVFSKRPGEKTRVESVRDCSVGKFQRSEQSQRTPNDTVRVPTPRSRFEEHLALTKLPERKLHRVLPTPVTVHSEPGTVRLGRQAEIHYGDGLENEAEYLADVLQEHLGSVITFKRGAAPGANAILLRTATPTVDGQETSPGDEAYALTAQEGRGVEIVGSDAAGVFYGIQTLRALLPIAAYKKRLDALTIDAVRIEDAPRFHYRGLHLDVARNFHSPPTVKKLLDLMAFYKLNHLQFHLTDDEGWRLAIAGLPELTDVGGRRGHTVDEREHLIPSFGSGPEADSSESAGNGHYSRQEFVDILRYAADRHIEVIPEIDLPGHSRAAIKAMQARYRKLIDAGKTDESLQYLLRDPNDRSKYQSVQMWDDNVVDVCRESTYAFIEHVVTDIIDMFAEAEAPLTTIHVGGDEVPHGAWQSSPACAQFQESGEAGSANDEAALMDVFVDRVIDILSSHGLTCAAWEDVYLSRGGPNGVVVRPARLSADAPRTKCYVWNNVWGWGQEDAAYKLANAGVDVVLCNATNLYFDLAYNKHPQEPGYYWAGFVDTKSVYELTPWDFFKTTRTNLLGQPISTDDFQSKVRLTPEGKTKIVGIQGQLWGENLKDEKRLEYMAFPKLIALAERAWAKQPEWARSADPAARRLALNVAWNRFANSLGSRELPRLDYLYGGVNYRIPPVGAVVENGVLKANVAYPGLDIRYVTDGTEPSSNSELYREPVSVTGAVRLRAFNSRARGGRSTVAVQE